MIRIIAICCLLASSIASAQEDFGRLFTTPSERANLDYLRKMTKDVNAKEKLSPASAEPVEMVEDANSEPPAPIAMEGYVKRSDGKKGTVWINHQPIRENTNSGRFGMGSIDQKNGISVTLQNAKKTILLKPGQTYKQHTDDSWGNDLKEHNLEN